MSKRHLPQQARRRYPPSANITPRPQANLFGRKSYLDRAASGDRFMASDIVRTATYRDANGNKITLKEHETLLTGPKDMRGGIFTTPTKKIGRR